jgi:hypothetical protein
MIRLASALVFAASQASAWQFTPIPVCTLSHETAEASLAITFDPGQTEPYAMTITVARAWHDTDVFSLRFDGARGMTISTDRHRISPDARTLSVTDRGFGNVLNGLEYNTRATALSGDTALAFSLADAAPEVRKFRDCLTAPTA